MNPSTPGKVYDVPKNTRKHFVFQKLDRDLDVPDGDPVRGE